jgi:hypothetical protein
MSVSISSVVSTASACVPASAISTASHSASTASIVVKGVATCQLGESLPPPRRNQCHRNGLESRLLEGQFQGYDWVEGKNSREGESSSMKGPLPGSLVGIGVGGWFC